MISDEISAKRNTYPLRSRTNKMKCFISYSHCDKKYKNKFIKHLKPLEQSYGLKIFDDSAIRPGEEWESAIWKEFDASDFVFLLISIDFINSDFCMRKEFTKAIQMHEKGIVTVIPIILKECAWQEIESLSKLKTLPQDGDPVVGGSFKTQDTALSSIMQELRKFFSATPGRKKRKKSVRKPDKPSISDYDQTNFRAVFFDLDGTLVRGKIGHEGFRYSWQLVWNHLGWKDDKLRKHYYQQYTDGKIEYDEWCDITCKLFRDKGLKEMAKKVRLTKNCKETLSILKKKGIICSVVSGGIDTFLMSVFPDYQKYFKYTFINKFSYDSEFILESIKTTEFDFDGKFDAIKYVCDKHKLKFSECVFVGEGRNDVYVSRELSKRGGLTIGYPSEHVRDFADYELFKDRLDAILDPIFGRVSFSKKLPIELGDFDEN